MNLADSIAEWIRTQVEQAGAKGAIVGLSGGFDSAVVSALAARGLGRDRVLGVMMPAYSHPEDLEHAEEAARSCDIPTITVDLSGVFDLLRETLPSGSDLAVANLKPRLRMLTLYYLANTRGFLVVGTGNKSELMAGYFTKYGDGGVDILPLGGLYKHQVRELARELSCPVSIIEKPPSAGLWTGQTDEAEMGITYEDLDAILAAIERGDTAGFPPEKVERVRAMMACSKHKRQTPPIFEPGQAQGKAGSHGYDG
jgi:NAD+ synthase